jgi:hypothetical protein
VRLEGLDQLKDSSDMGNRNRELPACSIVSQPIAPQRYGMVLGSI